MAQFERLISDLSARFIHLLPGQVDGEIQRAMAELREFFEIDRLCLLEVSSSDGTVRLSHCAYAPDVPELYTKSNLKELFPWCYRRLVEEGQPCIYTRLIDMPAEADGDRQFFQSSEIQSIFMIPLSIDGAVNFILEANSSREALPWPREYLSRLRLMGEIFVNALVHQKSDQAVRENEARLSMALDSADVGLWILDLRTDCFWISERAKILFGYTDGEKLSFNQLFQLVHPEDRQQVNLERQKIVRSGEHFRFEYRILRPDGELRWIISRGRTHFNYAGKPERIMGVSVDITERKMMEVELKEGKARLDSAIDVADLAFYDLNSWDRPAVFDNRFQQLLGIPSQEVHRTGDFWFEHIHPDDLEMVREARQKIHSGQVNRVSLDYRYCHPERGVRWLSHISKVIGGDVKKGHPRVIGVMLDITERKEMEAKLKSQLHEIEKLKQQLEQENLYLREETNLNARFENLDGSSEALKQVLTRVQKVAPTNSIVLIQGETGTGKELIAKAIHNLSSRKNRIMVKVNCASLPSALVESELFGREKGAYTGAMTNQIGRFELANGSTLFLDEIGELSLEVQVKLLRILQEGEFERLGSPKTLRVDVRVIVATNRNLLQEVQKGRFREDLYYRLKVFPIEMPPLRLRLEDIPTLAGAFIREFSQKMGKNIHRLPKGAIEAMQKYHWPGNIRELRNLIEQAFIISEGEVLKIQIPAGPNNAPSEILPLEILDRQHILYALKKCRNRIKGAQGAAQLLGLHPATLYSKMKKLGIPATSRRDDISTIG